MQATAPLDLAAGQITALLALVSAFHQTLVELYKFLWRPREKRYFEALTYIVFGRDAQDAEGEKGAGWFAEWKDDTRLVPRKLGRERRRRWVEGPQIRFVESLILRGVGDAPTSDISDLDVENAVRIARAEVPVAERLIDTVTGLINARVTDPKTAIEILQSIPPSDLTEQINALVERLKALAPDAPALPVIIDDWRRFIIHQFVPGEVRARLSLGNAVKSAELRYHYDLQRASVTMAIIESVVITGIAPGLADPVWLLPIIIFATAVVGAQAGNSILNLVIGLAKRVQQ